MLHYKIYKTVVIIITLIGVINLTNSSKQADPVNYFDTFQDGDIIFQTSKSRQSKAIQLATKSKYSHIGIIYRNNKKLYVLEAVQPVKLTPFKKWITKGEQGHYVVKRLKEADKILTTKTKNKMKAIEKKFLGRDYDTYFEWSDRKLYCSELVWKIYKAATGIELGKLETFKDFDLSNQIVKNIMRDRYGEQIPMDEIVISPASIFKSVQLVTIYER